LGDEGDKRNLGSGCTTRAASQHEGVAPRRVYWPIDQREAIKCRGKRFDGGWSGTEHLAFGPIAYGRDRAAVLATPDDLAEQAFERAVQAGIDEAATSTGNSVPLPIPEPVLKRIAAASAISASDKETIRRELAEAGREILLEQLDRESSTTPSRLRRRQMTTAAAADRAARRRRII
jgi:hypothetical protein